MSLQAIFRFNTQKFQGITNFIVKIRTVKQCIKSIIGLYENFLSTDGDLRKLVMGIVRLQKIWVEVILLSYNEAIYFHSILFMNFYIDALY